MTDSSSDSLLLVSSWGILSRRGSFPSACFRIPPVSSLLQLPPSPQLLYSFFFCFFFNKNSFPLADQQLMYHLDTTSATRPPFNREAWSPESTLSLILFPCLSHGPFIFSAPHADLTLCSCSASTETSSRRTSWSPNTKSSNSVTLGSPGFSVSL